MDSRGSHNSSSSRALAGSGSSSTRPPRKQYKKSVSGSGGHPNGADVVDFDHHTLATATTASGTISYSTDQGDYASDASEAGMEVVMSSSSNNSGGGGRLGSNGGGGGGTGGGGGGTTDVLNQDVMTYHLSNNNTGGLPGGYTTHSFPAGKHTFTVDTRYSLIRVVGSGAYGVVISSRDNVASQDVAIKMVPKAFSDEIDAKRILREIKLLKHFQHENIVSLLDMMPPNVRYLQDYCDVYLVTDLMETDLHRIIYSKQKLSIDHVQYFVYQVLRGLKYIHSCRVLHRDLKPSNLLVNANCDLKICDFGLARGIGGDDQQQRHETLMLTEYVVTRWYRAPEIMLACHEYSYPVDVWSVGCIMAELLGRKPYFPGDDYIDQLTIIVDKLGKLSEADLNFVTSDKARRFMKKLPNKEPVPLATQFPNTSADALDALRKMLHIHPQQRLSVNGCLQHAFFATLHIPDDEPVSSRPFDFSFEKTPDGSKLRRLKLQELIWQETLAFRPGTVAPPRAMDT